VKATKLRSDQIAMARIQAVVEAPTEDFLALLKFGGVDPRKDLRYHDWSDISFAGADLRNMDFTGARLLNCDFTDALIAGARFERATIDRVGLDNSPRTDLRKAKDWEVCAKNWKKSSIRPSDGHLPDGVVFQDAPFSPEMVVIPAGEFLMGSDEFEAHPADADRAKDNEIALGQGKRRMRVERRFALGRYPVTFEEYDIFLDATAGKRVRSYGEARDNEWGRVRRPVINVSWRDAQRYCDWLNRMTGLRADFGYRLPSESEWEYACRAGTDTRYWWGDNWEPDRANGNRSFEGGKTSPVGNYAANPWGLHDMIGNVHEWCADYWADDISKLPANGASFLDKVAGKSSLRALRGGYWGSSPEVLRPATRSGAPPGDEVHFNFFGFRVARTLLPTRS
jgi:formylglycine-generating enzyme required for sulfatase activity